MIIQIAKGKVLALYERVKKQVLKYPKLLAGIKIWVIVNFVFGLLFGGALGAYIGVALYPLYYDSLGPVFSIFVPIFTTGLLAVGLSFGFFLAALELTVPVTTFILLALAFKEKWDKRK